MIGMIVATVFYQTEIEKKFDQYKSSVLETDSNSDNDAGDIFSDSEENNNPSNESVNDEESSNNNNDGQENSENIQSGVSRNSDNTQRGVSRSTGLLNQSIIEYKDKVTPKNIYRSTGVRKPRGIRVKLQMPTYKTDPFTKFMTILQKVAIVLLIGYVMATVCDNYVSSDVSNSDNTFKGEVEAVNYTLSQLYDSNSFDSTISADVVGKIYSKESLYGFIDDCVHKIKEFNSFTDKFSAITGLTATINNDPNLSMIDRAEDDISNQSLKPFVESIPHARDII
jgi:hypothetical protein